MPPPKQRLVYWDASVFISFFQEGNDPTVAYRREQARLLLEDARKGEFTIVTSAFTRAEVRRGREAPGLTAEWHATISAFFKQRFIQMIPVDRTIAEMAAEYGERFSLRPPDAVQLATAVYVKAHLFLAWDRDFHRQEAMRGAPIPIEEPRWTGAKQLTLLDEVATRDEGSESGEPGS